ncbi:putative gustatory receptor 2a isoform X1 [Daphnia carinata]|uniref:putative gustatory receptor 2a isoform X1 n=1 Tax=Daphnia carinata TaxID=120202 RepID=UPI002868DCE4|nr:putative gustatory receptor 2a isoform X1 [Daphnia carinata]
MTSSDLPNCHLDTRFQSIFIWMKLLGISLTENRRQFCGIYDSLMFSLTLASNIASMTLMLVEPERPKQQDRSITSYVFAQILYIDNLNFMILVIGVHSMLLCQTRHRWKKLWATLQDVEEQLNSKILNRSFLITLLFIPEVIMIVLVVPLDIMGLPLYQQFVEFFSCASKIYPVSGMILFCLCGWIASDLLHLILEELDEKRGHLELICLKAVKKRYRQICQLIDDINQCFGSVILILITYMMASVVMVSFVAAVEFQHYDWIAVPWLYIRDLVLLIQHIINLVAITYIPHTIKIQHEKIQLALGRIETADRNNSSHQEEVWINCISRQINIGLFPLQFQLEFLRWDVSQSNVELTAAGLFEITPRLFPKLIGTTMTYVIILWQFQSSEKST